MYERRMLGCSWPGSLEALARPGTGSHSQVLEFDGIYANLYRTQAAAYQ